MLVKRLCAVFVMQFDDIMSFLFDQLKAYTYYLEIPLTTSFQLLAASCDLV